MIEFVGANYTWLILQGLLCQTRAYSLIRHRSERVSRTKIDGMTLKEAKYINLSLHYLEQVIVALHEKAQNKRAHVPYRNSMMTSILRDSLGGNCKTTMIATLAVEQALMEETISTCRFAQRVALIRNEATVNEELDLRFLVEKLKRQIESLKAELAIARGGEMSEGSLPDYEKARVKEAVDDFLADNSPDAELLLTDFRKIQESFAVMKVRVSDERSMALRQQGYIVDFRKSARLAETKKEIIKEVLVEKDESGTIQKLRQQITQRDHEISMPSSRRLAFIQLVGVLVSMLKAKEGGAPIQSQPITLIDRPTPTAPTFWEPQPKVEEKTSRSTLVKEPKEEGPLVVSATEKAAAFQDFRQTYEPYVWIEEQKTTLKQKYAEAKSLGEKANVYRLAVNQIKAKLEKVIMQASMLSKGFGQDAESMQMTKDLCREEESLRYDMNQKRLQYKDSFTRLKELKQEIEHLQHLLENARIKMQRAFESWLVERKSQPQQQQQQQQQQHDIMLLPKENPVSRETWDTPTPSMIYSRDQPSKRMSRPPSATSSSLRSLQAPSLARSKADTQSLRESLISPSVSGSVYGVPVTASASVSEQRDMVHSVLDRAGAVLTDKSVERELIAFYRAKDAFQRKQ